MMCLLGSCCHILCCSSELQVICWVLGEYGTADGKFSASYITGKLCDVAEAHSNDDTVKVPFLCTISCLNGVLQFYLVALLFKQSVLFIVIYCKHAFVSLSTLEYCHF